MKIKFIITQNQLFNYAGSEIATYELAQFLSRRGPVLVYTNVFEDPIKSDFLNLENVVVVTNEEDANLHLSESEIEILWVHHQLLPQSVLDRIKASTKVIFHHMSPYHPLEFPISTKIEESLATRILFNSAETKKIIWDSGVFNVKKENKHGVFGNPAPDEYFNKAVSKHSSKLKKLLIVSNHIPEELKQAATLLVEKGIEVEVIGSSANKVLMSPDIIKSGDAVVTIGKTVQYAICSNVPIYCYDHFGGPGYIKRDNYKRGKDYNFSGRGFERKPAVKIAKELIGQYGSACIEVNYIHDKFGKDFTIGAKFEKLIDSASTEPKTNISSADFIRHAKIMELGALLQKILFDRDTTIEKLDAEIEGYKKSASRGKNKIITRILSWLNQIRPRTN